MNNTHQNLEMANGIVELTAQELESVNNAIELYEFEEKHHSFDDNDIF